jgi:hypothetical protein
MYILFTVNLLPSHVMCSVSSQILGLEFVYFLTILFDQNLSLTLFF